MTRPYYKAFTASFTTLLSILPISLAHAQMISNNEDFKLYCSKEAYYFQAQSPDCDSYIQKIRQATRTPANQLSEKVEFPIGTEVKLSLAKDLSSKTANEGDSVTYLVSENVVSESGKVIIKKGASATGKVVKVKRSSAIGQRGILEFTVDKVKAIDGTLVPLRSTTSRKGRSSLATVIVLTVVFSPLLLSPLFLLIKGRNTSLKQGTIVNAYTDQGYSILSNRLNNSVRN